MKTDQAGIDFIKGNEGDELKPYNDNGKIAWGYGHDQQPGEAVPASITPQQAAQTLQIDLSSRFEPALNGLIPHLIPPTCTQNQWNALIDMAYNDGPRDVAIMLGHGWEEVPAQLPRWCWKHNDQGIAVQDQGLLARRQKEVALFSL